MVAPSVVIITGSEHAAAFRKRLGTDPTVALFVESESLRALEAIQHRPPKFLALDRAFIATARGAVIVARVKTDPHLADVDVRVLTEDEATLPLILSQRVASAEAALLATSRDRKSTRLNSSHIQKSRMPSSA